MLTKHIQRIITNRTLKVGSNKIITPHSFRRNFATTKVTTREKVEQAKIDKWLVDKKSKTSKDYEEEIAEARVSFEKLVHKMSDGDIDIEGGVAEQTSDLLETFRDKLEWKVENLKDYQRSGQKSASLGFSELGKIDDIITWYEGFAMGLMDRNIIIYPIILNEQLQKDKRLLNKSTLFIDSLRKQIKPGEIDKDLNNISSGYSEADKDRVKKILKMVPDKMEGKNQIGNQSFPLKDIPSRFWDKVKVGNDWDREYQVPKENRLPIMINGPWEGIHQANKRFKSKELLESFKKYANGDDVFYLGMNYWGRPKIRDLLPYNGNPNDLTNWYAVKWDTDKNLTQYLRDANKLFKSSGYGQVTSKEAFEFLQSIIESHEIMATVDLSELQQKAQVLVAND